MDTPLLNAVEMAAPSTPNSGKPKRPKIKGIVAYLIHIIHHPTVTSIGYTALLALAQRSGKSKRQTPGKRQTPLQYAYSPCRPALSSGPSPISRRIGSAHPNSSIADASPPTAKFTRRDTSHTNCTTCLCSRAPRLLRTQHGSTEINHLKHQKSQHDNLIDHPYGSHTVVRMAAQHNGNPTAPSIQLIMSL